MRREARRSEEKRGGAAESRMGRIEAGNAPGKSDQGTNRQKSARPGAACPNLARIIPIHPDSARNGPTPCRAYFWWLGIPRGPHTAIFSMCTRGPGQGRKLIRRSPPCQGSARFIAITQQHAWRLTFSANCWKCCCCCCRCCWRTGTWKCCGAQQLTHHAHLPRSQDHARRLRAASFSSFSLPGSSTRPQCLSTPDRCRASRPPRHPRPERLPQ